MPDGAAALLTAATAWEARPLAKALGLAAAAPGVWRGFAGTRRVALHETGIGAQNARGALERAYGSANGSTPAVVVSAGLCGALQPELRCADVVLDVRGAPLGLARGGRPAAERAQVRLHMGAVAHADRVLPPAEKRALGQRERAAAVDMESAAVREWAAARGVSFVAARAVLDELAASAPASAPEGEGPADLLRFVAAHWRQLPLLAAVGWRARRAMDALGRFLAEYLQEDWDADT